MPNGRIQSNQIVNALGEAFDPLKKETVIWRGLKLRVSGMIPLKAAMDLVDEVCGACVREEDGSVNAEMTDFALRVYALDYYAGIELPRNAEKQYEIVYGSDLYETVAKHINNEQLSSIRDAVAFYVGRLK